MNSEELEISLRTEFESHLKSVSAAMRQEISQLQEKIEAELEKQKSQLGDVFREVISRIEEEPQVDADFKESVMDHLRLARDEGARITATAIGEAEDLQKQTVPGPGMKQLREAVNDISRKSSQAEILKTLLEYAGQFTPRGAFFIAKNEHFVGWHTFGEEKGESDEVVSDISLPLTSDNLLSEAARSLVTVESSSGGYPGNEELLNELVFDGSPEKMFAIPLVVRETAVAVLYADYGRKGAEVSVEALETLVCVAGLTVELLASAKSAAMPREAQKTSSEDSSEENSAQAESANQTADADALSDDKAETVREETPAHEISPAFGKSAESEAVTATDTADYSSNQLPASENAPAFASENGANTRSKDFSFESTVDSYQPAVESNVQTIDAASVIPASDYQPDEKHLPPAETYAPIAAEEKTSGSPGKVNGKSETPVGETVSPTAQTTSAGSKGRSRERRVNVDLPIEVSDEERRPHNDACRFARLLVSEIILYDEKKVKEGRESRDLYDRLREAIDRSREMYDKRIQPPVAAKFDYFHHELVNTLAEGDENKLGAGYPGATV